MNKLDIKLGGHHLTGDDLLFVQTCLSDSVKAFAELFEESALILFGVEFTVAGPTLSWTAGWVFINNELCKVDAGSAALASNNTMVIVETYDSAGQQAYEDLNVEQTYIIRKATISGTGGGANLYTNLKRVSMGPLGNWNSLSYSGDWFNSGTVTPQYRKNQVKDVCFKGTAQVNNYDPTPDAIAFTLPVGFRPKTDAVVLLPATINGTVFKSLTVLINSSTGAVSPLGINAAENVALHLDDLRISTL